jgi:hypothetical protein
LHLQRPKCDFQPAQNHPTMTDCPNCGAQVVDDAAECPACGTEVGPTIRCERCETEFAGSDACPACGRIVAERFCDQHPDRVAVGRCVLCARAVCSEDSFEDRRVTLCGEHREISVIEGWAQIYSTTSEMEAQLVRDNLRAEGIAAQVFSQRDMMFNLELGELSIVRLLVPVWEYEGALGIIRSHMDADGEVAFACVNCGEGYEAGARECTECGAALV